MTVVSLLSYIACNTYMGALRVRSVNVGWHPEYGHQFLRETMTLESFNAHASMLHFLGTRQARSDGDP
jgi:hypothetical protein